MFLPLVKALEMQSYVVSGTHDGEDVAALTKAACKVGCLSSFWSLSEPEPCLQPRDLPLKDQSSWELMLALLDSGWEWERYQRPSAHGYVKGYIPGERKVMFSTVTDVIPISKFYLQALLRAQDSS